MSTYASILAGSPVVVSFKDFTYLFLERGEERERNINVCGKHLSVASHMPSTRDLAATQAFSLTENQTGDLSVCRMMPNQLSHTPLVRAMRLTFFEIRSLSPYPFLWDQ